MLAFRAAMARARKGASDHPAEQAARARAELQASSDTARDVIARGKTTERRAWHLADVAGRQAAESRATRDAAGPPRAGTCCGCPPGESCSCVCHSGPLS